MGSAVDVCRLSIFLAAHMHSGRKKRQSLFEKFWQRSPLENGTQVCMGDAAEQQELVSFIFRAIKRPHITKNASAFIFFFTDLLTTTTTTTLLQVREKLS